MFCYIEVTLLCFILLHQNGIVCATKTCPPGHRLKYGTTTCEACPRDQYKSTSGIHLTCDICSKCERGSKQIEECKSTKNTVCRCKNNFKPLNQNTEEICTCEKGFGLNKQECNKCDHGYFSDKDDSTCQKWRDCKSGILIQGTSTSDAVCKNGTEEIKVMTETVETKVTTATTTRDTTLFSTSKITPTATLRSTTSSPKNKTDSFYILWLFIVSTGILLLAGFLYRKCQVTHCVHNIKKIDSRKESVCRKPVEESGGEKSLSLLV